MGLLDKLLRKNQSIAVQFIDHANGTVIGTTEVTPDRLPKTFEVATTMHIQNTDWSVVEAIPAKAEEFIKTKKLILKLSKVEYINPKDVLYTLATISNELPPLDNHSSFKDFTLTILEDDWRQHEFLNKASITLAKEEILKIKEVWKNNSKTITKSLMGFDTIHIRDSIGKPDLNIDFTDLTMLLDVIQVGNLKLQKNEGFVKNAFAVKTDFAIYYGIVEDQRVTHLAISNFSVDTLSEVTKVTRAFDLIFIDWPQGAVYEK